MLTLVLIKSDGLDKQHKNGVPVFTARVSFAKDREHLYKTAEQFSNDALARKLSFH
ncbi:MAG: hypothetical protein KKA36_07460 [Gammaproteobacteria bacterium]|nr:hypothetical protein [Gammaproteobacteria bacterium]MBU2478914.1 hypothetical protein [Gammaproteobacteria bacterium]